MSRQKNEQPIINPPTLVVVKHSYRRTGAETQTDEDEPENVRRTRTVVATQTFTTQPPFESVGQDAWDRFRLEDGQGGGAESKKTRNRQMDSQIASPGTSSPVYVAASDRIIEISTSASTSDNDGGQNGRQKKGFTAIFLEPNEVVHVQHRSDGVPAQYIQSDYVDDAMEMGIGEGAFDEEANDLYCILGRKSILPPGLQLLEDVDHFFIQSGDPSDFAEALLNLKNKYDVIDSRGERLYYAGEMYNVFQNTRWYSPSQKYYVKLLDANGTEVMNIRGKSGIAQLRYGSTSFGFIEAVPKLCNLNRYWVKDETGKIIYQILHETNNATLYELEIFDKDMRKIGRLSKVWPGGFGIEDASLVDSYGVEFPMEIDVKKKALLLAALFALYFRYVGDPFAEEKNEKCAWCCICSACILVLILIIGFSFLGAYAFTK